MEMRMRLCLALVTLCAVVTSACANPNPPDDLEDYDVLDSGIPRNPDASVRDAAAPLDAGPPPDAAGMLPDAAMMLPDAAMMPPDAAMAPDAALPMGLDDDGDGLDDAWEASFNVPSILSPQANDTDNDGTPDGAEDPDGDGLTNLQEYRSTLVAHWPSESRASPVRLDLLVELDCMAGRCVDEAVVRDVAAAYAALPRDPVSGHAGVGFHVFVDETNIAAMDFDGSFEQRHAFLSAHPPQAAALQGDFPRSKMIHVAVVTRRTDIMGRGGELVTDGENIANNTGVLIFHAALEPIHPACLVPNDPVRTAITLEDALTATFIHEVGHTLQLGHDTDVGGGVNSFNIMSSPSGCGDAQERFHGFGNSTMSLGATEAVHASRFSSAAAALMDFTNKVSVDTGMLETDTGFEM